jgi:hypothetical protein
MNTPTQRTSKRRFSDEEDEAIRQHVELFGTDAWHKIVKDLPNRTPRQCRERWRHYLAPGLTGARWTYDEDAVLINHYHQLGSKWSIIRNYLPGRSDVTIKNRWAVLNRKSRKPSKHRSSAPVRPDRIENVDKAEKQPEAEPNIFEDPFHPDGFNGRWLS